MADKLVPTGLLSYIVLLREGKILKDLRGGERLYIVG